jgi:hypothetical protein
MTRTRSTKRAGVLTSVVFAASTVVMGVVMGAAAAPANAAEGCGQGYHVGNAGVCVVNAPGPGARFLANNPNCWINDNGDTRCYPGT